MESIDNESLAAQYKAILDESSIVSKTDKNGIITYDNDKFCEVSGYRKDELIGKNHNIIRHPDNDPSIYEQMWETIKSKKVWHGTIKNRRKDGTAYHVQSTISPIVNSQGEIIEYIAARVDVTDLIEKEKEIERQRHDPLTALQNRVALFDFLEKKKEELLSLVLVDIDRFSDINDFFGYEFGDMALRQFAHKLQELHANCFRISGDEFAIVCEHTLDENAKEEIRRTIDTLEHHMYGTHIFPVSLFVSCGISFAKASEVYKLSHIALKATKQNNKKILFFNDHPELLSGIERNIVTIALIKDAVDENRVVPYFQGIVDNRTKQIVKYEALIRILTEDGTVITPFHFLEHAKKAKLYQHLTKIMIKKTCETFAGLPYDFSINFTLEDILSIDVVSYLFEHIRKYHCGERLVIELVESEQIENHKEVLEFVQKLKKLDGRISIDDFGTGYSNYSYLGTLEADIVKIDGSLIKKIEENKAHQATVESILHFTKKMGMKTVAEFVEDEQTYRFLNELGVSYSQGYYFSKPCNVLDL